MISRPLHLTQKPNHPFFKISTVFFTRRNVQVFSSHTGYELYLIVVSLFVLSTASSSYSHKVTHLPSYPAPLLNRKNPKQPLILFYNPFPHKHFIIDMIIVLKDGYLVEQGTHEKLVDGGTVYSSMWAGKHSPSSLSSTILFYPPPHIFLT